MPFQKGNQFALTRGKGAITERYAPPPAVVEPIRPLEVVVARDEMGQLGQHPCPFCGKELAEHAPTGAKAGAWHCSSCGSCWVRSGGGWAPRPGHAAPVGYAGGRAVIPIDAGPRA